MGCCYIRTSTVIPNTTPYSFMLDWLATSQQFTGLFDLNIPSVNPWTLCDIEPPHRCDSPPFQPPLTPNCTMEDSIGFLLSLPRGYEWNNSLHTISLLSTDNPMPLTGAFDNACTNDCGGEYANYLENVCNDHFEAENTRLYCIQTNGSADVGPYCGHALFDVLDPSLFMAPAMCSADNSSENHCTTECMQRRPHKLKSCYWMLLSKRVQQHLLFCSTSSCRNHYSKLLYTIRTFKTFKDPVSNPWRTCGVKTPQRCTSYCQSLCSCYYYCWNMYTALLFI